MQLTIQSHIPETSNRTSNLADACLRSCRKLMGQLERAKERIMAEFKSNVQDHGHVLELAINEAEALAWQSGFPQLFFPTLAEENARAVAEWHQRQHRLLQHRTPLAAAA